MNVLQKITLAVLAAIGVFAMSGCGNPEVTDEVAASSLDNATTDIADDEPAGITREQTLIASLTIFVLAVFVGFELITKVPPTLHTPLMSGSNAVSGITLVGAALVAANDQSGGAAFFGVLAVIMATVNVIGGFMVTDKMLSMFKKK